MRKIIINADDFGITEGVTLGIIKGHKDGIISSTSLMVNMIYSEKAAYLSKKYPNLGLGVHLNVTIGKPVSDPNCIKSLVNDEGLFYSSKDYSNDRVRIEEKELLIEFESQIGKFIELTGKKPDHIDCHHMYDFFGIYPKITEYLIKKYQVPMRLEQKHPSYKYPMVKKVSILMNSDITEDQVCDCLKNLKEDFIELPNHSGYVDYELMKISSLNTGRTNDLHICLSSKVKDALNNLEYNVIKWSELI